MKKSKAAALAICGTVLAVLATFFHILGYFTSHWLESPEEVNSRFDRLGLWAVCFHNFGYDRDQLGNLYDGCYWMYSYELKPIFDWLNPGWFLSVQIMMTLVLIIDVVVSVILVLGRFGRCLPYTEYSSQFSTSIGMFVSGFMVTLSVLLFAINADVDRQWLPRPDQNFLAWSMWMIIISGFFTIFSAMCLLFDSLRIKFDNEKKNRTSEPYKQYKMKPVHPQYT